MPLYLSYTMVQKSQKWPKTQIKGGGSCMNTNVLTFEWCTTGVIRNVPIELHRVGCALAKVQWKPFLACHLALTTDWLGWVQFVWTMSVAVHALLYQNFSLWLGAVHVLRSHPKCSSSGSLLSPSLIWKDYDETLQAKARKGSLHRHTRQWNVAIFGDFLAKTKKKWPLACPKGAQEPRA